MPTMALPDKRPAAMRITWLDLNSSYSHASLALPLLHAACRSTVAAEWAVVSATTGDAPTGIALRVVATQPTVVAATAYLFTAPLLYAVLRRVKAVLPDCAILLGGPEFLGDNAPFLANEHWCTAVLRGDGEEGFAALLAGLAEPARWRSIPGLCWRDAAGACHDHGLALASSWPILPTPTASPFFPWDKPFAHLETTRGCALGCAFCTSSRFGAPRHLPLARVRTELEAFRAHGIREVRVLDRTFNADPGRALALLQLFLGDYPDMHFHLEIHPGLLLPPLRAALAAAPPGMLHLEAGLQTTHPEALAACGRAGNPTAAWDGLAFLCGLRNLAVHVDLLSGLPGLPLEHLLADLNRVTCLRPAEIQLESLKLLPGTPLRSAAAALGLVHAPDPPYEVLCTPQMPAADMVLAARLSRTVDVFYNHAVLQEPVARAVAADAAFYRDFVQHLTANSVPDVALSLERRARILCDFLRPRDAEAAAQLSYEWLRAGLPPAQCPDPPTAWKTALPAGATLVAGNADYARDKVRVWFLRQRQRATWFVFDRDRSQCRPVAIFADDGKQT